MQLAHISPIAVALIGLTGVCVTALVAWQRAVIQAKSEKRKAEIAEKEMSFQRDALSFTAFLEDWQNTAQELSTLIEETEVDRVLILRAWNGSLNPKWTTAVYQMREVGQIPRQYVHFELDSDYVDRLRHVIYSGSLYFSVDQLPECFIKSVYQGEGVKSSMWAHIETRRLKDVEAVSHTYVSYSSHCDTPMSPETQTRCMILTGRLKGLAATFSDQQ